MIAITWSYGRASLCELMGMWARQTVPIPLLVWLDGVPDEIEIEPIPGVHFHRAPRMTLGSLAAMRNASIQLAIDRFSLGRDDAIVILEDDDYYAPNHAHASLYALGPGVHWTGALRTGTQWHPDQDPQLCESIGGPGPHAAWAMRVGLLLDAGGYPTGVAMDDVALAQSIGWDQCAPHRMLTHVRRQHGHGLSSLAYDVARARSASALAPRIAPTWTTAGERLRHWCESRSRSRWPAVG